MWGLEGRQRDVQGLSGTIVAITMGPSRSCVLKVKDASTVDGQDRVKTGRGAADAGHNRRRQGG